MASDVTRHILCNHNQRASDIFLISVPCDVVDCFILCAFHSHDLLHLLQIIAEDVDQCSKAIMYIPTFIDNIVILAKILNRKASAIRGSNPENKSILGNDNRS